MTFYRDTIRTARKEHKCSLCGAIIKVGEKYHDKACNDANEESHIYYGKECEACQPVISEFLDSDYADYGYNDEFISDWWRDVKCYECKSYYLPCKPDDYCKDLIGRECECPERTKDGNCKAGDTCDGMTHYCRCENFKQAEVTNGNSK